MQTFRQKEEVALKIIGMSALTIPAVHALEEECFSHPWSVDSIEESFGNPNSHFFVCLEDDRVLGYISYYQIRDEAFINNVAVTASARRKGVGTALVKKAVADATGNAASFLSLEVRRSNQAAIALYESQGFDLEGLRKKFYRDPEEDAFIYTIHFNQAAPPCCADAGKVEFI